MTFDQAHRRAEITLNRYFHSINSDIDHLVHAMLYILINNPTLFPFVPRQAMDIAFKNVVTKMSNEDLDTITMPMLIMIEDYYRKHGHNSRPLQLSEEVKDEIEEALDRYLEENNHHQDVQQVD